MFCSCCNSNILSNHILEDNDIPLMKNNSIIIYPKCSVCGNPIQLLDVSKNIKESKKVLLITGTAGTGKTAIGQLIESKYNYIFVDGDAIQKRVNYFAKRDLNIKVDADTYQTETINTMLILLGLGYNVVVGYIINKETLKRYTKELAKYEITPILRVLVPERSVCLQRDLDRECWTAGEKWVDMWYDEMRAYLITHKSLCIDNSNETLEETFNNHFVKLIQLG